LTVLAQNLKVIRKNLNCTQMKISKVLGIGFRTYVRYEAGERDAPVAVLVKLAKLGNISLDRLLTSPLTLEGLKIHDVNKTPNTPQQMEVVGGGLEEGRLMFKGLINDHLIATNKLENKLLNAYRKLNRLDKKNYLIDVEWVLYNPKNLGPKNNLSRSPQKQSGKN